MSDETASINYASEEPVAYVANPMPFTMKDFETLSNVLGFSQAEWSAALHISLRTLQRYLKDGTPFEGLHAELLTHLSRLTQLGLSVFQSEQGFITWLRTPKQVLGYELGIEALNSITGIRLLREELGRMAHGVYI